MRPAVVAAKAMLAEGRQKLRRQHDRGSPGIQLCALVAELLDRIVLAIHQAALEDLPPDAAAAAAERVALVAHGGHGRRDVAPFSDVDLMLLHDGDVPEVEHLARRLTTDIFDAGLTLGLSVRTPLEARSLAFEDIAIFTSLAESRLLTGNEPLFDRYFGGFQRQAISQGGDLLARIEAARREEQSQYGETVYLLEPNVKGSTGGLRDVQWLRWTGFARFGETDPELLRRAGRLARHDQLRLRKAHEFLLRLRNELHFHANRAQDVLNRAEQVRLAEAYEFRGGPGLLPVEQFMREYFSHSLAARDIVRNFVRSARPRTMFWWLESVLSHQVEGDFQVGLATIAATDRGLDKLRRDASQVLRLLDLSNLYDKRIDDETWKTLRDRAVERHHGEAEPGWEPATTEAYSRLLSILARPIRLGDVLRRLHELRVLERLVPGMGHARGLLQFNQYHKYTVDEHCLRAVERATEFRHREDVLGEAYQGIKPKRLLHLALLLHDLGKGRPEDHSEAGRKLAAEMAVRCHLPRGEAETLEFLVHKHLRMAHLAFRRDTSDESLIVQFAVECGTLERVRMLYVLTCADLAAVGPGVLNQWKLEVLTELYHRTLYYLAGDSQLPGSSEQLLLQRNQIVQAATSDEEADWLRRQAYALPRVYLMHSSPAALAEELRGLQDLPPDEARVWSRFLPERDVAEYSIAAWDHQSSGIFHRVTGALTSLGLRILSAEIHTLASGLALDRFYVHDLDLAGPPSAERLEQVRRQVQQALLDPEDAPPRFRRFWQPQSSAAATVGHLQTQIRLDNTTSDTYTVIDVFTHDRQGLLYAISRTLSDLGLSVGLAKIATHLDQVVDVFYVVDARGEKILDEGRQDLIRARLSQAIDEQQSAELLQSY